MNEQETIRFILENSSEPVIKNPVMRAALQEPRTMAQEPRNMAQGGRIIGKPGGLVEPGIEYYGKKVVSHEESLKRRTAIKNYIKNKGKVIDGYEFKEFLSNLGYKKPRDIVKGLEEGGMFTEDILGKKTITKTERPPRTGINLSKSQITTLNKYASLLNKQEPKKYTSSVFTELGDLERANILNRARLNDWEFKATTKWDPLTPKQQQNIIETFDLPEDAFKKMEGIQKNVKDISGKYGVPRYLESGKKNPLYDKIQRYAKNGFKFSPKDMLPIAKQREIIARFELPGEFEKWNFEKYKYGIPSGGSASNPAFTKRIIDYAQGKTRFPNLATDAGTPQGWMMNNYYRTYEYEKGKVPRDKLTYKPIFETINGRQKVVGFVDNTMPGKGNTYFGIKKWHNKHGGNLMTTHPDFKNVKKFVDISKRAYAEPNKVIMGLLKKGGIESTGKLQLKHVLNYLAETQGYKATEDAVRIHHQAGVGAGGVPGEATRDLQLLKSEVNSSIRHAETRIRNAVVNNLTPNIDDVNKLKNLGASIKVGGKIYGGGSQTAIGQFKAIEKGAEQAIKKWEPKDFNKFKTILQQIGCPGKIKKADGGRISFQGGLSADVCMARGADNIKTGKINSPTQKANYNKMMKVSSSVKGMKMLKNILGPYGIGGEVLIEGFFAANKSLMKGTPLKEAWQSSWMSHIAGGAYDEKGKKLAEQDLLERRSNLGKGAQEFSHYNKLIAKYYSLADQKSNVLATSGSGDAFDEIGTGSAEIKNIDNKMKRLESEINRSETRITTSGGAEAAEDEYNKKIAETQDADAAKSLTSKGQLYVAENDLNKLLEDDFSEMSSDALPLPKVDTPIVQSYKDYKPDLPSTEKFGDMFEDEGYKRPDNKTLNSYINEERIRQEMEQPGILGASDTFFGETYAEGGLAGLMKKYYD